MTSTPPSATRLRRWIAATALSAMLYSQTVAAFTISNTPLFLPQPVDPNIVFTLDDSGSMRWAYAPDSLCADYATRRAKSAHYNPLYYNPHVRYEPAIDFTPGSSSTPGTYTNYLTSFTAARVNGFDPTRGSVDLSTNFRPTWAYDPSSAVTSEGFPYGGSYCSTTANRLLNNFAPNPTADYPGQENVGVPAYYYVFDPSGTSCSPVADTNDACYRRVVVSATSGPGGTDERQNFANWYSFYRTRNLATATAATLALRNVPSKARVAWQSLSTCKDVTTSGTTQGLLFTSSCKGWDNVDVDRRIRAFDDTHRANMYNWISRLPANGGTPLRTAARRVGEYFRSTGKSSPYAENPHVSVGTEYSCRPNFHILMTDGMWNDEDPPHADAKYCGNTTCGNKDAAAVTLPDGTAFDTSSTLTRIYRDSNSDSLSDVTFHYWSTDLRPDLKNNLIPYRIDRAGTASQQYWNPKNDPATWQHVVTFTVGLGMTRSLSVTSPVDIRWSGSTYAGAGYQNLLSGAATWPATAKNADPGNVYDLWHAAINSRGQAFSADRPEELVSAMNTALNRILERESAAAALATNSTRLTTDTMLFQARFNSGDWTGKLTAYRINTDGTLGTTVWEATDAGKIPAHGGRNIYTWSGSGGIDFTQSDLTAAGLWSHIGSTALLNYLRGDASNEERNGGTYRNRSLPLGDIINSDPAYVGAENYGYASFDVTYRTFLTSKNARRKMLYVGANDGMLHAFDALTGEERFAYVPRAVLPNLAQLAQPTYGHRYYVDGSPAAYDAKFGGGWKTVLVGTTGAGAKSVFALDVTDPDAFGPSKILWEINDGTPFQAGDAADPQYASRLGYTIGSAVVFKANNGEWVAAFGNGYDSATKQASLYLVRVSDGRLIRRIDTLAGGFGSPNGLGTPTVYDANGDDVYDYVYATDMLGNVWKFDLSASNAGAWNVAYWNGSNPAPLFTARSASPAGAVQPLQARVELARPPAGVSGVIVVVGTGRFFAVGDNIDTVRQTFYGILDNGTRVTTTDRSQLVQQTIGTTSITLRGVSTTVRTVTSNPIDWTTKRGWYMDLPSTGERVIGPAVVRAGRVIFTTVVPSSDPCEFGGTGWLMEVSATTGARLPYSVFDTNGDGLVNDADSAVTSGVPLSVGIVKQPQVMEGSPTAIKAMSGTSGNIQIERNRTFTRLGRDSWREVTR